MGGLARPLVERGGDQLLDSCVIELARRAGPRLIEQSVEPALKKAAAPLAHRLPNDTAGLGHLDVVLPFYARQDDPRTQRQSLRGLMPARPLEQLIGLLSRQLQLPQLRSLVQRSLPLCPRYRGTRS